MLYLIIKLSTKCILKASVYGSCIFFPQADHLFTEFMAGSNKERAMLIMANHVKAANAIYKDTVFGPGNKAEGRCFCCFGLLFILSRNEYLISCAS